MDRLNTRNILKRKKQKPITVSSVVTILKKLLSIFSSAVPLAKLVGTWQHLGINWDFTREFFEMMQQAKTQSQNPFFMEFFIIAAWQIWKQRNNFIFDRGRPSSVKKLGFKLIGSML
jgi:hypothetical protein